MGAEGNQKSQSGDLCNKLGEFITKLFLLGLRKIWEKYCKDKTDGACSVLLCESWILGGRLGPGLNGVKCL